MIGMKEILIGESSQRKRKNRLRKDSKQEIIRTEVSRKKLKEGEEEQIGAEINGGKKVNRIS